MEEFLCKLIVVVTIVVILLGCFYVTPWGRAVINSVDYANHKIDETTSYALKKEVEDTCRAMIASYEADRLTYEQYNGVANDEKQSWADQAKMRANTTASNYNNYILKNKFVWNGNVPPDIRIELQYLQ